MGEFFVFITVLFTILLTFGLSAALLFPIVRRHSKRLDRTVDHEVLARVLEDLDRISTRLAQVEEEMDFFKELRAPERKGRLPAPAEGGEEEDGGE